jgi:hypothetical protein
MAVEDFCRWHEATCLEAESLEGLGSWAAIEVELKESELKKADLVLP